MKKIGRMTRASRWLRTLSICSLILASAALRATPVDVSTPRPAVPPNVVTTANRPMMMLATSKDHSLFGPIYTDFEDIDGDNTIDTTFLPTFKYYGYFDPTKCYTYSTGDSRFNPAAKATITEDKRYTCASGQGYWSGNFLNWATMTRLDVVRKMLYGGKRSTDTSTLTILERTNLSKDSHSFVKYYRGTDINDYTPFTVDTLKKTSASSNGATYSGLSICNRSNDNPATSFGGEGGTPVIRLAKGNYRLWATVDSVVCEWGTGKLGTKLSRYYKNNSASNGSTTGTATDAIAHEASPPDQTTDGATYSSIGPELTVRVRACDPNFLGEERCQAFPPSSTTNYKPYGLFQEFGLPNAPVSPSASGVTAAPNNATAARAEFGVITGSYDKNLTAGALRRNMGDFVDEINTSTGVFCHAASSGCVTTLVSPDGRTTGNGAIKALDNVVLYGRGAGGNYGGSATQLPTDMADGTLPAWGNPVGEMVVQALQYYAGVSSSNPTSTTNDTAKGLPVATWTDPLSNSNAKRKQLYGNSVCRPMYVLALSSSALSFDGQADTAFETLKNRTRGNATLSLSDYTDAIGKSDAENLEGKLRSVGSVDGNYGETCAAKTITTLSKVSGICPEAPAIGGTYQVAGAAYYANTSRIRTLTTAPADLDKVADALKVKTLAASLSGGVARIDVVIPGTGTDPVKNPAKHVYITPESLWNNNKKMPGAMLTFASISSSATHGAFVVTWNDALFGGDYDMDIAGFLRYDIINSASGYQIKVTTDIINVGAGATGTHGFSIIGTNADGRYLTHRHNLAEGFIKGASGYECSGNQASTGSACNVSTDGTTIRNTDYPVVKTFNMVGVENVVLNEPLWYAAKYGSYTSSVKKTDGSGTYDNVTTLPLTRESWDKLNSDGSPAPNGDGTPDGYFLARRPDLLEQQLRRALDNLAKTANTAPTTSSRQYTANGLVYSVSLDSTLVASELTAYPILASGQVGTTASWKAGQMMRDAAIDTKNTGGSGNLRQIITNSGNYRTGATTAVPFRWASLPDDYKTQMTTASPNHVTADNAQVVLNYIRGDQSNEQVSTGLRERGENLLGPVVNATPWVQQAPSAFYSEAYFPGYSKFYGDNKGRKKLLWVASNDGMLHAFDALLGKELFAYLPGPLANRLAEIPLQRGAGTVGRTRLNNANFTTDSAETQPTGTVWAYVDGSPYTGDVQLSPTSTQTTGSWKTYAFGSLGRGGKAFFALDVTNVSTLEAAEATNNAPSIFKWQFTADDDPDLGYVVNDIRFHSDSGQANPIVKLNNGKFAVLLHNGYKSTSGKAVLYLLMVDGPNTTSGQWTALSASHTQDYNFIKIEAQAGTGNGLSTPTWIDLDGNGTADVVYAGDLKGNLWKFDLTSTDPLNWGVAYKSASGSNLPLFTAVNGTTGNGTPLPITTAPEYAFPPFDGQIINFATGYSFDNDADFPNTGVTQRVYGIWDRKAFGLKTDNRPLPPADLSTLVTRTASIATDGSVVMSGNTSSFDWATKDGWYFNLPDSSEMVLSDPTLSAGQLVFTSVRPKIGSDNCSNTPDSRLYIVDPLLGTVTVNSLGTGTFSGTSSFKAGISIADQKVSIVNDRTGRSNSKTCKAGDPNCICDKNGENCKPADNPDQQCKLVQSSSPVSLCYSANPRVQWREIPGLRTDQ